MRCAQVLVSFLYTEPKPTSSESREETYVPSLASLGEQRPGVICDFMEYTHKLRRCLREFFSMLKHNKSRRKCKYVRGDSDFHNFYVIQLLNMSFSALFTTLETCLQNAASLCVPPSQMTTVQVKSLISDTLQNKFKTQQVMLTFL